MAWVDLAIIVIIALSAAFSVSRGFLREAIGLVGWVVGLWAALTYMEVLGTLYFGWIESPAIRLAVVFVLVLMLVLVFTAIVNRLVGKAVSAAGVGGIDRILGMIFGAARGALIVAALVILADLTDIPDTAWWFDSSLLPPFRTLAVEVHRILPSDITQHLGG